MTDKKEELLRECNAALKEAITIGELVNGTKDSDGDEFVLDRDINNFKKIIKDLKEVI